MSVNNLMIQMIRGDTFELLATFEDLAADLSAAAFTVKANAGSAAVISKTINSGITKVQSGTYKLKLDPADTSGLTPGQYYYGYKVTTSAGDVYTIISGIFEILQNIA